MVPIAVNLHTVLWFPQYHFVFDDNFAMTPAATTNQLPHNWEQLFTGHSMHCLAGESFPPNATLTLSQEWLGNYQQQTVSSSAPMPEGDVHNSGFGNNHMLEGGIGHTGTPTITATSEGAEHLAHSTLDTPTPSEGDQHAWTDTAITIPEYSIMTTNHSPSQPSTASPPTAQLHPRPGWNAAHRHNTCYKQKLQAYYTCIQTPLHAFLQHDGTPIQDRWSAMVAAIIDMHQLDDGTSNFVYPYPCAFQATREKENLHYGKMLQAEDCPNFAKAMKQEVTGLSDTLEVVARSTVPPNQKPLPAIWVFKWKHLPDWTISKWKAHLNSWWLTEAWCELLGNFCPSCELAYHQTGDNSESTQ